MAEESDTQKGFKVHDKRRFTDEGEAREQQEGRDETVAGDQQESTAATPGEPPREAFATQDLPPIDFSTFIMSLSTQALMQLGEIGDPATGQVEKDVAVAKQTIDIIGMLCEKSKGNLDETEDRLVQEILYNLRMRYVEAVRNA